MSVTAEHRGIALVEQDDLAVRIEHAQSLRHVLERGVQHDLLASQFALGAAVEQRRHQRNRDDRNRGTGGEEATTRPAGSTGRLIASVGSGVSTTAPMAVK